MTQGAAVPQDDDLCRFVRLDTWDASDGRPTAEAFRASKRKLSVFHVETVESTGKLQDLCFGRLANSGEAVFSSAELRSWAEQLLADPTSAPANFEAPVANWSANGVPVLWKQWADAHVDVESAGGNPNFPLAYRQVIAERCRIRRAPSTG